MKDSKMFFAFEIERTFIEKYEEGEFVGWDYSKGQVQGFEGRYYFKRGILITKLEKDERLLGETFEVTRFKETAEEFFTLLRNKENK